MMTKGFGPWYGDYVGNPTIRGMRGRIPAHSTASIRAFSEDKERGNSSCTGPYKGPVAAQALDIATMNGR